MREEQKERGAIEKWGGEERERCGWEKRRTEGNGNGGMSEGMAARNCWVRTKNLIVF
jgi:hypothetical protein